MALTMTDATERNDRAMRHWCLDMGNHQVGSLWDALMRAHAELDATRARLAQAEHKLEAMVQFRGVRSVQEFTAERDKALLALAASTAREAQMRAALRQVDCLLMENAGDTDEVDYLPGTTRAHDEIERALALSPQSNEALRALLERAVRAGEDWASDSSSYWGGTRDYDGERAAIVDALLPAGDGDKEGGGV